MTLQHVVGLEPCPLCISQRIVVISITLVVLIAAIHNPQTKGKRNYGRIVFVLGLFGIGLAVRQLYLQSLPVDQAPACMPGLDYLVEVLPLTELITVMFSGTGDCAEVQWSFLGLTIPGWTLVCFICYSIFGLLEMVRKHHLYK
ncbi:disulfide bond formation protein B [Sansalvadorimonas sp. 2012CJ34-2]|uniref:Disulfide bond formation protein B n=1 Tax=Parendozoicomonas callyspongiae TaxID=2942213 RepID=A0ABT0PIH5_9GAMM|nr:disulfide bond formation protein B [Sansalvadorimonas sp. 2012CJ34-2]